MVVIRLAKGGRKKRHFYRVVVTDSRKPCSGRYLERLGYYDPLSSGSGEAPLEIAVDRVQYWVAQGAQLSDRVRGLLKKLSPISRKQEEAHP